MANKHIIKKICCEFSAFELRCLSCATPLKIQNTRLIEVRKHFCGIIFRGLHKEGLCMEGHLFNRWLACTKKLAIRVQIGETETH